MSTLGPLSYTDAVIAIAARDPALASILIHHHECIEEVKRDGKHRGAQIEEVRKDGRATLLTTIGTLISALGFVLWQILTHPHGFGT